MLSYPASCNKRSSASLSKELLLAFFTLTFQRLNHKEKIYHGVDPKGILSHLPINLKTSLLLFSYYGLIKNVRLLQINPNFTASLIVDFKLLRLKKGEVLYRMDDPSEEGIAT